MPKENQHLFPAVGQKITVEDKETCSIHDVIVGSQYRLAMSSWYSEHKEVRPGDTVVFERNNSHITVSVQKTGRQTAGTGTIDRSGIRKSILDEAISILSKVEDESRPARICMGDKRFSVEWGEDIKETEIIIGG